MDGYGIANFFLGHAAGRSMGLLRPPPTLGVRYRVGYEALKSAEDSSPTPCLWDNRNSDRRSRRQDPSDALPALDQEFAQTNSSQNGKSSSVFPSTTSYSSQSSSSSPSAPTFVGCGAEGVDQAGAPAYNCVIRARVRNGTFVSIYFLGPLYVEVSKW